MLEEKLCRCEFDLNEAELKSQQLQKRIKELEEKQHTHDDRHNKLMEVHTHTHTHTNTLSHANTHSHDDRHI